MRTDTFVVFIYHIILISHLFDNNKNSHV